MLTRSVDLMTYNALATADDGFKEAVTREAVVVYERI
jgi:hypothetical protein